MTDTAATPLVSVITPVHNGAAEVERAVRSVAGQTFPDWELLVVDDCSTDGTAAAVQRWAQKDGRIRLFHTTEQSGACAARNIALEQARGEIICYLDHDDEYYPQYLEHVAWHRDQGDVLVFGYDFVYEDGPVAGRPITWNPERVKQHFFATTIVTPLGVAHRRGLMDRVGGFNELLWREGDWDLWKRLARTGARFTFLALKSGRYHVRRNSVSRAPRLAPRQQETVLENYQAGRPIFGDRPLPPVPRPVRKVAFVSPHCVIDFTNGAATATLDGLQLLAGLDFECHVFCSSRLDAWEEVSLQEVLAKQQAACEVGSARFGPYAAQLLFTRQGNVPITVFQKASTGREWQSAEESAAFLAACESFLTKNRPDVVWTYGGDPISLAMHRLAKRLDIPVLFALHNFGYGNAKTFRHVDYTIVPSQFARQFYWEKIGLACQMLPLVIDPKRTRVENWQPRYVTFVNPEPRKGIHVFARIAEVLSRRRPDIPLLLVEGASRMSFLPKLGVDLSAIKNLEVMANTPDPREFYAVTKVLLMPSLMENAGFVAIEAMLNGIPVLGSNRGALSETIGENGFCIDIPAGYTTKTRTIPTAEEVEPWVETTIRLWDDQEFYQQSSAAARMRAQQWCPEQLATTYREFFGNIFPQPGPPLVPQAALYPVPAKK